MRKSTVLIGAAALAAGCATAKPPVASYGPPPPVREPAPSPGEELILLLGDDLTEQEQRDLVALREARYDPPPGAEPPSLASGLDVLLQEQGAVLLEEKIGYDIPIVLNDRVEWWIDYFTGRIPDSFERYLIRSGSWAPYLKARLRAAGLPEDLVYLSMIESGFSSRAVSRAGAVGPWQFMPYTGRDYGLRIDRWVDERMDWERSTSAAIAYLSDLHAMFGSWYLAAAGYNGGQGRVGRSMMADNTINFWELTNLHSETKNYVPKLIAATIIAKEPASYGFGHVAYLDPIEWEVVTVATSTDLDVVADAAEVSPDVIRMLNPHLVRGRTPPGEGNFRVKIPAGRAEAFNENYYEIGPQERIRAAPTHLVRSGETLEGIASAYQVDLEEMKSLNDVRSDSELEDGMVLTLPEGAVGAIRDPAPEGEATRLAEGEETDVAGGSGSAVSAGGNGPTVDRGRAAERPLGAEPVYRVRRGDTLTSIARRYGVTVEALMSRNGLDSDDIRTGQTLTIPR